MTRGQRDPWGWAELGSTLMKTLALRDAGRTLWLKERTDRTRTVLRNSDRCTQLVAKDRN